MTVTTALAVALGSLGLAAPPALADAASATTAKVERLRGLVAEDLRVAAVDAGTAQDLRRRLDETQARLAADTQRAADGTFQAFVNHVRARRGKTLQAGAADVLTAVARGVAPPPLTVDPAAATSLATLAGDVPVTVTIPAGSGISRLNVAAVPPPSDLPRGQQVVASTDISATDVNGATVSQLSAPVTLDLTVPFAGDTDDLAIVTRFPSGAPNAGAQEVLDTSVTDVGAGYRLTATTTHFSPFTVVVLPPPASGVTPQGFVRTQNALGPHAGHPSSRHHERRGQGSVVLADGRVLVASLQRGRYGEGSPYDGTYVEYFPALAEIFDPTTGSWTRTGDPILPITRMFAFPGGQAYALSGPEAQLWDPVTGEWSLAMPPPRAHSNNVTQLLDGRLISSGGGGQSTERSHEVWILDPTTMDWSAVAPMTYGRGDSFGAVLADGRYLVAGGDSGTPLYSEEEGSRPEDGGGSIGSRFEVEIFDPVTGQWSLAAPRYFNNFYADHSVLLPDGRLLVAEDPGYTQIYDPQADTWTEFEEARDVVPRGATLTLGPDGRAFLAGGTLDDGSSTGAGAWTFDPKSNTWTERGNLLVARVGHTATSLPDGTVLLVGGDTPPGASSGRQYGVVAAEIWTGVPADGVTLGGDYANPPADALGPPVYVEPACDQSQMVCS